MSDKLRKELEDARNVLQGIVQELGLGAAYNADLPGIVANVVLTGQEARRDLHEARERLAAAEDREEVWRAWARLAAGGNHPDEHLRQVIDRRLAQAVEPAPPVPMILLCPACGARHVDRGRFATKPHHTHACQSCGFVWRPAVAATVGVQFLPGFRDLPASEVAQGMTYDGDDFRRRGLPLPLHLFDPDCPCTRCESTRQDLAEKHGPFAACRNPRPGEADACSSDTDAPREDTP